jgi:hypothetical protein
MDLVVKNEVMIIKKNQYVTVVKKIDFTKKHLVEFIY